jgi:hypothetical protein
MTLLGWVLYWVIGFALTLYAGKTTYFPNMGYAIVLIRPLNALLIVALWVGVSYYYIRYRYE